MADADLSPDHRELIELLNRHAVEFLVVGGWAVIAHGYPRLTVDIVFFVRKASDNAERLYRALTDFFGARPPGIDGPGDFLTSDVVQFGATPNRVDFITRLDGVEFEEVVKSPVSFPFADRCFCINMDDLIRNKRAAGRKRDMADVEELEKIRARRSG